MVPIIRSLVSFAAGISRMSLWRFTLFSFLGSLPFTALLVFAGVQLGANWESVGAILKRFEYAILAVLVLIALAWIWIRIIRPRRAAGAGVQGTR
jgi:membrane protein DedA with SNARE-associated domain